MFPLPFLATVLLTPRQTMVQGEAPGEGSVRLEGALEGDS